MSLSNSEYDIMNYLVQIAILELENENLKQENKRLKGMLFDAMVFGAAEEETC